MNILVYRLLNILNEANKDSLEANIAENILKILDKIENYSIDQVANICHVSKSTLSKFVRKLNFECYKEFREFAIYEKEKQLRNPKELYVEKFGMDAYVDLLKRDIDVLYESISFSQIKNLAQAIHQYSKVAAFGSLYSQTLAMDLAFQMGREGKYIRTFTDDIKQEEFFNEADENTLIIIFSNSGQYLFSERMKKQDSRKDFIKKTKAKIALVTRNSEAAMSPLVSYPVVYKFSSEVDNNVILNRIIITMIQNEYNKIIDNKSFQKSKFPHENF